jgi:hypothetical protein
MKGLISVIAFVLVAGGAYAASIPKDENSIAKSIDACVARTQTEDVKTRLAPAAAREFCNCYSRMIVMFVTDEEYTALLTGTELPSFLAKYNQVSETCLQRLLNNHLR